MAKKNGGDGEEASEVAAEASAEHTPAGPAQNPQSGVAQVIAVLEGADRQGLERDHPEGARWIVMSDTLAKRLVALLKG